MYRHELIKIILDELNVKQFRVPIGSSEKGDVVFICDIDECWYEIGEEKKAVTNEVSEKILGRVLSTFK